MPLYKPESLELLKQRIDLVEVVSTHVQLQRSGAAYKALCPFHEEKTPSFMISKGDKHYHCYGCGAHGDAIAFLMSHLKMSFVESVESLAERFHVRLEKMEGEIERDLGPNKLLMRQALDKACRLYHYALLHSEEAEVALRYLNERGVNRAFIEFFQIGFAPKEGAFMRQLLHIDGFSDQILADSGLIHASRKKDFFCDRITFPVRDLSSSVVGFSARKYHEETFGGKYINTPETALFKKSHLLFGLSYSRQKIVKERKAIIVEGQMDALRLIYEGFNYTVAGQGTAFTEHHVNALLKLGVNHIFLALDADDAGEEAAVKIGLSFQRKGIEVSRVRLPEGLDPDSFVREQGPEAFAQLLKMPEEYLAFLVRYFSAKLDVTKPSGKNELVQTIAKMVRSFEEPLMVFESLRKLALLTHVPESFVGVSDQAPARPSYIKRAATLSTLSVDPDRILETDLLRLLFLAGGNHVEVVEIAQNNLPADFLRTSECRRLFELYMKAFRENRARDLLSVVTHAERGEDQAFLSELFSKKINLKRAKEAMIETVKRLLEREWMRKREAIREKIQNSLASEEELLLLVKQFDALKDPPTIRPLDYSL